MKSHATFLLGLMVTATSCNATMAPDLMDGMPTGAFITDASNYEARSLSSVYGRWAFNVVVQYTNSTSQPIYLARCFPNSSIPIYGVQLTDGSNPEGAAYNQAWGCVGHNNQILVAPGATRVDTLTLGGPNSADGITGRSFVHSPDAFESSTRRRAARETARVPSPPTRCATPTSSLFA